MARDRIVPTLYPQERQDEILALARRHGRVEVAALADAFGVTTETVRRDLSDLQRRKLLRRVHGGAILWSAGGYEPLITHRNSINNAEKERIAMAAIAELPPEGTVLLDSGTTTTRIAQHLTDELELTIVTNSLVVAQLLANHPRVTVMIPGGVFDKGTLAVVGEQTVAQIRDLRVDTVLLGTDGISVDGGLTTPHLNHAAVKRAMVACARRVVTVADSSKVGHDHFLRFATLDQIDTLITDTGLDDDTMARLEAAGPTVIRA
jgi:DeoR family transcriptional regulator, fructose operon transcriptional repressor